MSEGLKWLILFFIFLPGVPHELTVDRWFEHTVWQMRFEDEMERYAEKRAAERRAVAR